jgi:hypothetical protein
MSRHDLRDRNGHLLGWITTTSSGKQELRNPYGHLKGTYDPKTNQTCDPNGHLVARGNLLTTLL